jgi:hypothetical protein
MLEASKGGVGGGVELNNLSFEPTPPLVTPLLLASSI